MSLQFHEGTGKKPVRNETVLSVQEMLRFLGFMYHDPKRKNAAPEPLECDGLFGAKTEAVVMDFQESVGILVDGVLGPVTMECLEQAYSERRLELDSPGAGAVLGEEEKFVFERVPADKYGDGYDRMSLRNDVAGDYRALYDRMRTCGAMLTTSGGIRALSASGGASRSMTSNHYLGRAFDLFIFSGMVDPGSDPFVVERIEPRSYRVHARCDPRKATKAHLPEEREIAQVITYRDRTKGAKVRGRFIDFTALAGEFGFKPIKARKNFESGASRMGAEWWHFQHEGGLVPRVSTFGQELLRVYARRSLEGSGPWRFRDRIWKVNWS